jgi:hypothetical protein
MTTVTTTDAATAEHKEAQRVVAWTTLRADWLHKLRVAEIQLTAGVSRGEQKKLEGLVEEARQCFASPTPPERWEPVRDADLMEPMPFDIVTQLNHGRHRERAFEAGETDPNTGQVVAANERRAYVEDIGVAYAQALVGTAKALTAEPPLPPSPEEREAEARAHREAQLASLERQAVGMYGEHTWASWSEEVRAEQFERMRRRREANMISAAMACPPGVPRPGPAPDRAGLP